MDSAGGRDESSPRACDGPFLPLTPTQHGVWLHEQLLQGDAVYSVNRAMWLHGQLDVVALRTAFADVLRLHRVLSAVVRAEPEPGLVLAEPREDAFRVLDLSDRPDGVRRDHAHDAARAEITAPFDTTAGPLVRALLVRLSPHEHLLVLNGHHLVLDGVSAHLVERDIAAAYDHLVTGRAAPPAARAVPFEEYARRRVESTGAGSRALEEWIAALRGLPATLDLLPERPGTAASTHAAGCLSRTVAPDLALAVRKTAAEHRVTLFTMGLVAFSLVLGRYSGEERFALGTTLAGRFTTELEDTVGMLADTVPLPVDLSGDPTGGEMLSSARSAVLAALSRQDVSFAQIVDALRPERIPHRTPVFQVAIQQEEPHSGVGLFGGLRAERLWLPQELAQFELTLVITEQDDGIDLSLQYRTALFEADVIKRMLQHVVSVLARLADTPHAPASSLSALPGDQYELAVRELNAESAASTENDGSQGVGRRIDAVLRSVAEARPDGVAVVQGAEEYTYGRLWSDSRAVAAALAADGVRPGDAVGLLGTAGYEAVAAMAGILVAGGHYVPLDPMFPDDRIAHMLSVAGARHLVTAGPAVRGGSPDFRVHPVPDLIRNGQDGRDVPMAQPADLDSDLAYVIFTSGSTGDPKAVGVPHRGVLGTVLRPGSLRIGADDGMLWHLTIAFDPSVYMVWSALLTGGKVVTLEPGAQSLDNLADRLAQPDVTVAGLTPALFAVVVDHHLEALSGLRKLLVGGDVLPVRAARRMARELPGTDLVNVYGPTENSVISTASHASAWDDSRLSLPIGSPVAGTSCYVLDERLELVPPGTSGELFVGGDRLARGYLGEPALTAGRFLPDPFAAAPGARMYRTGDRVCRRPDGQLTFLGRLDNQVKIRGYRVEPGEVEAALVGHPAVRQAVVVPWDHPTAGKRLAAYLVPHPETPLDEADLRQWLVRQLPPYMVPASFRLLEEIPLNQNHKPDHLRLPAPEPTGDTAVRRAPRTAAERQLAGIFADALGAEGIGVEDDFFALGGDSLLAMRVAARAGEAGYRMTAHDVFAHHTVAGLAAVTAGRSVREASPAPAPEPRTAKGRFPRSGLDAQQLGALFRRIAAVHPQVTADGVVDIHPLSPLQSGMLFHSLDETGSRGYLRQFTFETPADIDPDALGRAWTDVARRHDALRTTCVIDGVPRPLLIVHRELDRPVTIVDLTGTTDSATGLRETLLAEMDRCVLGPAAPAHRLALVMLPQGRHRLVWTVQHLLLDGWSISLVLDELFTRYAEIAAGREETALAAPVSYRGFVEWLGLRDVGADEEFWRGVLGGVSLPTPLVLGGRGSGVGGSGVVRCVVDEGVVGRLEGVARELRVTLGSVVQAAWGLVLHRYCGLSDVVFGSVSLGRFADVPGVERMVGLLMNTVPLRVRVDDGESVGEFLSGVHERLLAVREHEHSALVDVQRWAGVPAGSSLFDSIVAFDRFTPRSGPAGSAFPPVDDDVVAPDMGCPLLLEVDAERGLSLQLVHELDSFEGETAQRVLDHLVQVLRDLSEGPDILLSKVGRTNEPARRHTPAGELPPDACLHQLFERQVRRAPDAIAVVCGEERLTYGELNERANRLAHHLRDLGVGPETIVGVSLERGPDLIPALLGVLKSGGAYVPLDPAHPVDRLTYILDETASPVVISASDAAHRLEKVYGGRLVVLDRDAAVIAGRSPENPAEGAGPGSLAYTMYTSGSTGRPKGVCLTHSQLWSLLALGDEHFGFGPEDVWALFHSYAFDVSVWEMWGALAHGGQLVVVPFDIARSPDDLLDLLVRERVTVLCQTPSAFRPLAAAATAADSRARRLSLRAVVFAGERLNPTELDPWISRFGLERPALVNMYGITETAVYSTYHRITQDDLDASGSPIGRALGEMWIHLLDEHGLPVPAGAEGEVYIGGAGVARGYLRRPALTAERFVPDPFGPPGSRRYRSGDLAREEPDGTLDFIGRIDDQVKIRGYRVELGEVQSVLAAQPGVRDAAAVVREYGPGDLRLVAYVVPEDAAGPDSEALRAALARHLPAYMVPASIVVLDALPLTVNGKLDRRALPDPGPRACRTGPILVEPRGPVEETLAVIWKEVLGLEQVGAQDNFFDLGGDSLVAIQVATRSRAAGVAVKPSQLFAAPTIAQLASAIVAAGPSRDVAAATPAVVHREPFELAGLDRTGIRQLAIAAQRQTGLMLLADAYPLSPLQAGMLFHSLYDPDPSNYVRQFLYDLKGDLDPYTFERAWTEVADRHTTLRTTFAWHDLPQPLQLVWHDAAPGLAYEDWSHLDASAREEALAELLERDCKEGFDVHGGPAHRMRLIRTGKRTHRLLWTVHHMLFDGWSVPLVLGDLIALYGGLSQDGAAPRLSEPVSYRGFVEWLGLRDVGADEEFWRGVLGGVSLPTPLVLGGRGSGVGGSGVVRCVVDEGVVGRLEGVARELRVTLGSVVQAAWGLVLHRYCGLSDVVFGSVSLGRFADVPGVERMVGLLMNTVPLRVRVDDGESVGEFLSGVHERLLAVREHEHSALVDVQRWAGVPAGSSLFDSIVVVETPNGPDGPSAGGLTLTPAQATGSPGTGYPLVLQVDAGGDLSLQLFHALDSFDGETAQRVLSHVVQVLEGLAKGPDTPVADVAVMPAAERRLVLDAWNATDAEFPSDACLQELFERQVRRTPDAVAVVCGEERVTYRELNERANRLAHHLRDLGVGPETVVGVCLEHSTELLVALWGIVKSGGAYVPLDPRHPAERRAFALTDSAAEAVVTQQTLAESFSGAAVPVVRIDVDWPRIQERSARDPQVIGNSDNLVYVMYTSGSTGRPKGVMISHRGLVNYLFWCIEGYGLDGASGAPMLGSIAFDLSVPNFFLPLIGGRDVTLLPPDDALAELAKLLGKPGDFSLLKITPAHLDVLRGELPPGAVESVRTFVVGADEMRPETAASWRRIAPGARIINEYGPTETVVGCSVYTVPEDVGYRGLVPIGKPIANTRMYVLDDRLDPVPVGVTGELYIGGEGVARGYLGRPGLTAERFLPDPHGAVSGARFYRTGDLARFRTDGELEFLGRIDHQVKIRGYRIELGEIEAALLQHSAVREAVVAAREDQPGDKRLAAYVVLEEGNSVGGSELHDFLRERLPAYMLPAAYTVLDALPLSQGGKVDRRLLPAPVALRATLATTDYEAPKTPTEQTLADIWSDVLGLDRVGVHDNFFMVGGDSIRAMVAVDRVRAAFEVTVPLVAFFQNPTVAELSTALRDLMAPRDGSPVRLRRGNDGSPLFLFPAQGGSAAAYLELAGLLVTQPSVYALQSVGFDSDEAPFTTVEEIARAGLEAIRKVCPAGPYRLAGWSFGGLVAFEAARQLEAAGESVALLGILDTPVFRPRTDTARAEGGFKEELLRVVSDMALYKQHLESSTEEELIEEILRYERAGKRMSNLADSESIRRMVRVYTANGKATTTYRYDGTVAADIHLLRSTEQGSGLTNEVRLQDWQALTSGTVTVHPVPGRHAELLEMPSVQYVADVLTDILKDGSEI
ncbi:amino acid adenylation domain-containing protein (plasmid) [Streptomyces cynarae]|uniref:Amino acid adenylation domain-containing protein n=1 Tax=Streptomyces cynarae TaxID=2981134 RepID=A0ABY6EE18_9ACTN|nr:non-ribosomal peptide synthetase [Streptomyces cynarae]UXY24910.1 amino acid adenylation domain-containing protein [Streptomyces cynarae]